MNVKIITLEGFDEEFCHPVRLRIAYGCDAGHEADRLDERDRFMSAVTAAVNLEPFDRMR